MLCVVALLDQRFPDEAEDVSVTLFPAHRATEPEGEMTGAGTRITVSVNGLLLAKPGLAHGELEVMTQLMVVFAVKVFILKTGLFVPELFPFTIHW